jgi:hypothetical protein
MEDVRPHVSGADRVADVESLLGSVLDDRHLVTCDEPIGRLPSDEVVSWASVTGAQAFCRLRLWQICPRQGQRSKPYPCI